MALGLVPLGMLLLIAGRVGLLHQNAEDWGLYTSLFAALLAPLILALGKLNG